MEYSEKLDSSIRSSGSHVVVGLDPDISKIPDLFLEFDNPVLEFNRQIILATKDIVAGYKLNIAFYEYLEEQGIQAVRESLKEIPDNLIKICDAKRGDIANTAELYARTYFDKYCFDAVTASPYMGKDSLEPFYSRAGKCVYILALTSNESSKDFQHLEIGDTKLYKIITESAVDWGRSGSVGFVFGANYAEEIGSFSAGHPDIPLLIPGIGAQGNELKTLLNSMHTDKYLINSSRAIIYSASKECSLEEFRESARNSAEELNRSMNR